MSGALQRTQEAVSGLLTEIAMHFKGRPKITLVVRHPNLEAEGKDADFIMSDDLLPDAVAALERQGGTYQARVGGWMEQCFTPEIVADREERNHRFLEEALELVQATGCTAHEAHQLVGYVFGRPVGEPAQEVGGVMVTLAAACNAFGLDMVAEGERELARILDPEIMEKIRRKQAGKPKHSPLPQAPEVGS